MVSVLGLKLDHDRNELLFNLDEKFQNYDANAVRITRRDVVLIASQIFDTQGFVSPYVNYSQCYGITTRRGMKT